MSHLSKLRIGIVGAGNIGRVHMDNFSKLDDVALTGVTDVYSPLAEQAAAKYGISNVFSSAEALIHSNEVDAVIVGVPNQYHAEVAIQALKAGKHVLLEKPMAVDLASARSIMEAYNEANVTLMMSHQMRWDSVAMQVKEQMDKGSLGHIYNAKAGWFRRKGIPGWGTWFTQRNQSGGGPLIDIGVHLLDLSLYLMGNPKPVSVYGSTYAEFGPKKRGIGTWGRPDWNGIYDVEDLATALIKLDNGATLSLEVSWAVHMDTDSQPFVHLMGSDGGASYRGSKGKLLMEHYDRPMEVDLTEPNGDEGARLRLSRHFVECVREGKEPISSALSGFTNSLILDSIYESSRTGHEIKLNW